MMNIVIRWCINALSLYLVSKIVPGIELTDFGSALIAVVIIGLVNALIKPIFVLLTLPINILTLGLFTLVLNGLMLWFAGTFTSGFVVHGFGSAFIGSILLSIISTLLFSLLA